MASGPGPSPATNIGQLNKLFNSSATSQVAHMNRVLSTAAGIDGTLMFVGYTLKFTAAQLSKVLEMSMAQMAEKMLDTASKNLKPGETLVASVPIPTAASRLADAVSGMQAFSGMCSDVRMFLRLFGLMKVYIAFKNLYQEPPKDSILYSMSWLKMFCVAAYYALENQYYLASKGVIKGLKAEQVAKSFKACIWIYGGYIIFDYVALYRQWQLQERAPAAEKVKVTALERRARDNAWWRAFYIDAVYTPLTFHWGIDGGIFSDTFVGALGAFGGFVGLREAWRATA